MGALEFNSSSGHSVGELRRLIAQAQARGQAAQARSLELELNWRMRRMAARHVHAVADPGPEDVGVQDLGSAWAPPRAAALNRSARGGSARAWQLGAAALAGAALASVAGWWMTSAGFAPRPAQGPAPGPAAEAVQKAPTSAGQAPSPPAAIPVPAAPAPASPAPASPAQHRPAACRAPATPGQQAVCASRSLLAQDQRMLRAYQRAVAAGANRLSLDRGQAHWRELRDQTSSPARLAQLYRTRIAALDAAARRAHGARGHARHHGRR